MEDLSNALGEYGVNASRCVCAWRYLLELSLSCRAPYYL
jgi:hypothetical protein